MITKVSRLTCLACGYDQRCKIVVIGATEVMPKCLSCGASSWVAWPKLAMPELEPAPSQFAVPGADFFSYGEVWTSPVYTSRPEWGDEETDDDA